MILFQWDGDTLYRQGVAIDEEQAQREIPGDVFPILMRREVVRVQLYGNGRVGLHIDYDDIDRIAEKLPDRKLVRATKWSAMPGGTLIFEDMMHRRLAEYTYAAFQAFNTSVDEWLRRMGVTESNMNEFELVTNQDDPWKLELRRDGAFVGSFRYSLTTMEERT